MRRGGLGAALLLTTAWLGAGCARGSSMLLVEVAGDATLRPAQLQVAVAAAMREKTFMVPPDPTAPFTLPASFSVELDPEVTGPLVVYVAAYDEFETFLADGETRQTHIIAGGQTIIAVTLRSSAPFVDARAADRR